MSAVLNKNHYLFTSESVTEGNEFLGFAKQAVSRYELVEHKYLNAGDGKDYYTISMQHCVFAVHAFVNAIARRNAEVFSYLINENQTVERRVRQKKGGGSRLLLIVIWFSQKESWNSFRSLSCRCSYGRQQPCICRWSCPSASYP